MDMNKLHFILSQFSFSSFVSSIRGKFINRILPVLLCFLFLFSVPSFASDDLHADDFSVLLGRQTNNSSGGTTTDYFAFTTETLKSNGIECNYYKPVNYSGFWPTGATKIISAFQSPSLIAGHEYQLSFATGVNFNAKTKIEVYLNSTLIYSDTINGRGAKKISINFKAPDFATSDTSIRIECSIGEAYHYGEAGQNAGFLLSKEIGFNDNTDNPGWLGKILEKFTALGDRIGNFFTNLSDNISEFFNSLGDRISGFFTDLKDNLSTFFSDLGDRIKGFFVQLVDDIKSLFIPPDDYFSSLQTQLDTFCTEHLGALYQGSTVLINLIKKVLSISPDKPSITMPAIQFYWKGKLIQLTEPIQYSFSWVSDSSHPLYTFYKFYRGFSIVSMFVAFLAYLRHKYITIFGGD